MLTNLRVRGFKCLRDVSAPLAPLTVLIGKNDTGKSSFLDAILALTYIVKGDMAPFVGEWDVRRLATHGAEFPTFSIEVGATTRQHRGGPEAFSYSTTVAPYDEFLTDAVSEETLEFADKSINSGLRKVKKVPPPGDGLEAWDAEAGLKLQLPLGGEVSFFAAMEKSRRVSARFQRVRRALSSAAKYRFDPHALRAATEIPTQAAGANSLLPDGTGLPLVLGELAERRSPVLVEIETQLHEAIPSIERVLTPTLYEDPPKRALHFQLKGGGDIPATLASEGALLYLAYLALAHQPQLPSVLLLEEPENGIHPQRLRDVVRILHHMTAEERGESRVQVILTTHSPYLLDFVDPEGVLVFGRDATGDVRVRPLTASPLAKLRRQTGYTLGELWFNVGEEELLKDAAS